MNFRPDRREELELNITPLIDVVFLLLIFFMVTTTFQQQTELQIKLPTAQESVTSEAPDPIRVVIGVNGQYVVEGQRLPDNRRATLIEALGEVLGEDADRPLIIRADGRTPHQAVVRVMDAAAQLGIDRLSIATSRPRSGDGG